MINRKLKMKKMKLLFILICLISVQNLFAYKVVKNRDHWGIFGGFDKIEDAIEGHTGNDGKFYIDKVTLTCTGNGNDKCEYNGQMVSTDDGVFEEAGLHILNNIFKSAEEQIEGGVHTGSISITYAILQGNGTYKYFHYIATWNQSTPNKIEVDINEII
jgi:hypothetical protein